jgi:S-adenosylmethionine-diacylgycerolhomoserine-N-methlytransferase
MTYRPSPEPEQAQRMRHYYRWQSKLYDWTRWTFLFGRKSLIRSLPLDIHDEFRVLEVGCGTGHNLKKLAKHYPNAQIHGIDVSRDMLRKADKKLTRYRERVQLKEASYGPGYGGRPRPDVILISYCLTMVNPGWRGILERAIDELAPGGILAVVDFHDSRHAWFKRHMAGHHVRMDGHLLAFLNATAMVPEQHRVTPAYGGLWEWMLWVGRK